MNPDFLDLLRSLLAADVRFMVVGAYAVGVHGHPRATKDLDVWVEPSIENAPKVIRALVDFGAPLMGLTATDLETPGVGLQIGKEPLRVDVLTKVVVVVLVTPPEETVHVVVQPLVVQAPASPVSETELAPPSGGHVPVLVPANDKYFARIMVLRTLCERIEAAL